MTRSQANFDLNSLEFKTKAYEIYDELRQNDPIHELTMPDGKKAWLVTRYEDAVQALKDYERFSKMIPVETVSMWPEKERNFVNRQMICTDPPDHTRLRSIVSKAFSPQMVEEMEDGIQEIANSLIDRVQDKGRMDLIQDYAFPLPIIVISRMLGIPDEDYRNLKQWSNDLTQFAYDSTKADVMIQASRALIEYIEGFIADKRKNPGSDLTSMLIQVHENGDGLDSQELASMIRLFITAGHETTVNLIGNGVFALLENPEQLRLWQSDPSLAVSGVEELMRYYSPVEFATANFAVCDFEWEGKKVSKGDTVFVGLASANRDPEQFEHPDKLDITRKKNNHIAFGSGIHFCLGAPLARLEGKIALSTLLRRLPDLRFDPASLPPQWRYGFLTRGLDRLPVLF